MRQPLSVAVKRLLIRTTSPRLRRQLLAWSEQAQDLASRAKQALAALGPLPDFIIIGAQKCGTTYLYDELVRHPDIRAARVKEIHYFDVHHRRGPDWYRTFFPRRLGSHEITGEASPGYLFHPHAARRAAELAPHARLIVLLRNPVARAYSHYHHERRLGYETLSFREAIRQEAARLEGEAERLRANPDHDSRRYLHYSYLARGIYVDQLKAWRQFYPAEQMLVLKSEDFARDPDATLRQAAQFLGLPAWTPDQRRTPKLFPYPRLEAGLQRELADYFAPHNQRLYAYLGADYGWDS